MESRQCPQCHSASNDGHRCARCGLDFQEYEKEKQACIGRVYGLINSGELEAARELAEESGKKFPDSRADFLLLLSNINRDISIVHKLDLARKAFDQGDFEQVLLLLRNIKAFDQVLDGKVISLRRQAERFNDQDAVLARARAHFEQGEYGPALELFSKIDAPGHGEEIGQYLERIEQLKKELFQEARALLGQNRFEAARGKFEELEGLDPAMAGEIRPYLAIIERKAEIREQLLQVAGQARREGRDIEARVLYEFLCRQWPDLRSRFQPYVEEIGDGVEINLADSLRLGRIDCSGLGFSLDREGLPLAEGQEARSGRAPAAGAEGSAPEGSPVPLSDTLPPPADIDGEGVADFTY